MTNPRMACGGCGNFRPGDLYTLDQCRLCWLNHHDERYRAYFAGELPPGGVEPAARAAAPAAGPGTELEALLAGLGLTPRAGCACKARADQMNRWGPAGCRARRDEILAWLREEYRLAGWGAVLAAAGRAVLSGLAFRLDPFDPIPGLLDEAVRRAEAAAAGA